MIPRPQGTLTLKKVCRFFCILLGKTCIVYTKTMQVRTCIVFKKVCRFGALTLKKVCRRPSFLHTFALSSCPKYRNIVCQRDPIDLSACPTIEQMKALDARICGHPISLPAQSSRDLPRMIVLARHDRPNLNHRAWRNLNQIVEICPYKTSLLAPYAIRPEVETNLITVEITQRPP